MACQSQVEYEKALKDMDLLTKGQEKETKFQALNHNHSHFIFAHDGSTGEFGKETVVSPSAASID
jgi:hypothetical protein